MIENIDLFENFKNVFPGDSLVEDIEVKNNFSEFDFVKIYLRAESHSEAENPLLTYVKETEDEVSANDFLSQLSLTVFNGSTEIFSASPDETDGLSENVLIGVFRPNEVKTLRAVLSVPLEMGNEYAHRAGEVDWIFSVEGFNDETIKTADTGFFTSSGILPELVVDYSPLLGFLFAALLSAFLVFKKPKSSRSRK